MSNELVVITDSNLPGDAAERTLAAAGFRVAHADSASPADVIAAARQADALIVQWAQITRDVLDALPRVRFVSRLGIGYDMVDVAAATSRGVLVANTPEYCIEEVASHTLAMMMALGRGLPAYDRATRRGEWSATQAVPFAVRPSTATVGVVGYGRIGSLVAQHCRALGFRVIVHDPGVPSAKITDDGMLPRDLDALLSEADVVTLHAPLNEHTRHLINVDSIALMKRGAVVVNTCRGPLVDQDALAEALESGALGAAGLDVFDEEPLADDSRLRHLENVLLSPHAAWFSPEALADLPVHAARNVVDYFAGETVASIVNRA